MNASGQLPSAADLGRAARVAAALLAEMQEPDGDFPLVACPGTPPESADNLFSTATILALAAPLLPADRVARAAAYLLARRDSNGLWAWVWGDKSLPPDADDTACCLGALAGLGSMAHPAEEARLLRRFWRWGGPFRTWLAQGEWNARDRDDAVVNCNILWALDALGMPVRRAERRATERMLARQRGPTRYYCSEASLAWAAARVGLAGPPLAEPPASRLARGPLECALWTLALPAPPEGAAALLLDMREADGGWAAEPWVRGYGGAWESRAVTTGFVLAALSRLGGAP